MKKSIQDEIDALRAETAAAYAAIASYNREKEFYRQQADEAAVELENYVLNSCVQTVKMLNCCRNTMC